MLVTVKTYRDVMDAQIDKSYLESQGVQCVLENEYTVAANWFYSQAIGGIKLKVEEKNIEKTRSLLAENN